MTKSYILLFEDMVVMFAKIVQILVELGASSSATLAAVSMVMWCCWASC
jgi:hypothetical protein